MTRNLAALLVLVVVAALTLADRAAHTNNWAVLVCTSRFWFNYRHMANTLAMYRTVRRLGIPDSNIILMLADDAACNARNPFAGTVYANANRETDLYGDQIQVDYKGEEVSVDAFLRLLTGRVLPSTPRSKRLLTDSRSNVFVYMTGHGGANFLKFRDHEELSSHDIADAFQTMNTNDRYNELLFMIDTCQANTMYDDIISPRVLSAGSSDKGENSYSHHSDDDIGVAVADRFTHHVLEYLEHVDPTSNLTFEDLFASMDPGKILSHPGVRSDLFERELATTKLTDFFGSNAKVVSHGQHDEDVLDEPDLPPVKRIFTSAQDAQNHTEEQEMPNAWGVQSTHLALVLAIFLGTALICI